MCVVFAEAATGGVQQKKLFLEISLNSQESTCAGVSFLIKSLYLKRDSGASVFLWILENF